LRSKSSNSDWFVRTRRRRRIHQDSSNVGFASLLIVEVFEKPLRLRHYLTEHREVRRDPSEFFGFGKMYRTFMKFPAL
jgi:hypothetical protein